MEIFSDGSVNSQHNQTIITLYHNVSGTKDIARPYEGMIEGPCVHNSTEYEHFYLQAQYVTGMIIYPVLCIIGITGNSLALVVLSHKNMATSTNVYLSALAVSDTIKLLNDLLYFIMLVISTDNPNAGKKMMISLYPFAHYIFNMSVCVTAWLTVSVAVERYISVCYPTQAKQLCTIPRARLVCIAVFVIMILLSLPSALRYTPNVFFDSKHNMSCHVIGLTELGANTTFMVPYQWIQNSLRSIIPLIVLIYLNVRIINELRKERVKGKKLSSRNKITLMLIIIIVVFVVCITPDAVMSTFFGFGYVDESNLVKGVREITDSLLAVNSAFNFLLYCSLSMAFRNTLLTLFCGCKEDWHSRVTRRSVKNGSLIARGEKNGRKNYHTGDETYV